jgi:hypothetical protein
MRRNRASVVLLALSMSCAVCSALVLVAPGGSWPGSWPKELESVRDRATTLQIEGMGICEVEYQILLQGRDEFEAAWPHILELKSKGAPLVLERSPYVSAGQRIEAGVCIKWPAGSVRQLPDGTRLEAKAPWPQSARLPSGDLPEYVVPEHGTWVPATPGRVPDEWYRARVDIILVVDGRVVDLNRLELPGETPIVDRRFPHTGERPAAAPVPAGVHAAAFGGHGAEVERLLAAGTDVDARDPAGRTPLHFAAEQGHLEVVQLLLAGGANVNAGDDRRQTPLHRAAQSGHRAIVEALLKAGTDVNATDLEGRTPTGLAVQAGHEEVANLLREHGGVE